MGYVGTSTCVIFPADTVTRTCTGPYRVSTDCPVNVPSLGPLDDAEAEGDDDGVEPPCWEPEPDDPLFTELEPADEPDEVPEDPVVEEPAPLVLVDAVGFTASNDVR
ncbi:hypothetical protein GCM10028798_20660 [Humibacter antri]